MTRTRWQTQLRAVAVTLVLLAGASATLATTAPVDACPSPPADGVVSDFYGQQDYEYGTSLLATPHAFLGAGGLDVARADVTADYCLTADDTDVTVRVEFTMDGEHVDAIPEETLRTLTVSDGLGRTWSPERVDSREWEPPMSEGGNPHPAYAWIDFLLPIDIASPVSLHLGELRGSTVDELSLDEPGPGEDAT